MKNKHLLLLIPFVLVALGVFAAFALRGLNGRNSAKLQEGRTYACWLVEAEVAGRPTPDRGWDLDGSAPDLMAVLRFRDNTVLTTNVARDALIARWQPLSLSWKDLAAGEIAAGSIRKVAHVTLGRGDFLTGAIFDHDFLDDEFVGGFSLPLDALRVGENELLAESDGVVLKRVLMMIVPADSKATSIPQRQRHRVPAQQIEWAAAEVSSSIEKEWTDMAQEIKRSLREASRTIQDSIERSLKDSVDTP